MQRFAFCENNSCFVLTFMVIQVCFLFLTKINVKNRNNNHKFILLLLIMLIILLSRDNITLLHLKSLRKRIAFHTFSCVLKYMLDIFPLL